MASTFLQHYHRLKAQHPASEQRYQVLMRKKADARTNAHIERMQALVKSLSPAEREKIEAELQAMAIQREHTEHLERYVQMNADHQNALRMQVHQARGRPSPYSY